MEITDDNREMFEVFCNMHPHEAYELNPDELIKYMHKEHEQLTAEEVIELLKETE